MGSDEKQLNFMVASGKGIVWGRVLAIAAVQSAIALMWITYRAYLGKMLGGWGFSEDFTTNLLTFELFLGFVMEPVFGLLSDRQQRTLGSFAPLITIGVLLSSAVFVGLPLVALLNLSNNWLLPLVAIAWALAMTTFRAPIYVLLWKSAPTPDELPLAMGLLTMAAGLMALFKVPINAWLLSLGAIPAFVIGSVTLLGASTFLRFFMPPLQPPAEDQPLTKDPVPWTGFSQTMLMAIAVTWGGSIVMGSWSRIFADAKIFLGLNIGSSLNLLLTLLAIPVGWLASRYAKYPLLAIALGWLVIILAILLSAPKLTLIPVALVWVWAFGTMRNGTIPYVFEVVSMSWRGFSIGLFFGMSGVATALFPLLFPAKDFALQGIIGMGSLAIAALLSLLPLLNKKAEIPAETSSDEV